MITDKTIVETSLGKVWVSHFDNGDISVWTPKGSQQSEAVAEIIDGRAAWKPKFGAWFVPEVHVDAMLGDLEDI